MSHPTDSLRPHLPMFVLDVIRWVDSYDSILDALNGQHARAWRHAWGRVFEPPEIDGALLELKEKGLIEDGKEAPDHYRLTPQGQRALDEWTPPGEAGEHVVISRMLRSWDPIGVFAMDSDWPQDEYESYVPHVIKALTSGASKRVIRDLLGGFRVDHMCLKSNLETDGRIAREICAAWSKLQGSD